MEIKNMTPLSASRIKTLEGCSWSYYCNYTLRLPQIPNEGASKGSICHSVFELLLNKKHKHHYDSILAADSITGSKAIERLTKRYFKVVKLDYSTERFAQIDRMILVGLKADFFGHGTPGEEKGEVIAPEYKFEIANENPAYLIKGFIDKPIRKASEVIIDDFKSSKKKFEGDDIESNLQGLMYSLAAKKLWPELKSKVRFVFLQYPEEPLQCASFTDDALRGFEYYLAEMQKRVNEFNIKDAYGDFAYNQTCDDGSFKGKLLCGFAKTPGELKKDGKPKWHCQYKFSFPYYAVMKNGYVNRCAFDEKDIQLKDGETIEKKFYEGCPIHNNSAMKEMKSRLAVPKKEDSSFLDDF